MVSRFEATADPPSVITGRARSPLATFHRRDPISESWSLSPRGMPLYEWSIITERRSDTLFAAYSVGPISALLPDGGRQASNAVDSTFDRPGGNNQRARPAGQDYVTGA